MRVSANISEFEKDLRGLEKGMARMGAQLEAAGARITTGISLPLAAFAGIAAKAAIDFESSFAGVKKTVNATDAEFAQMAQGLRDLAKTMPVNVNELNKIAEAAGQLGVPKDSIIEFTKVMAQLGATTNLTADQAATSIAQIQNIFNASGQSTSNFASALVALGNAGASTESQIVEFASRLSGAGHQIGLSQAEVLGFGSALANMGLNAELGGTAFSQVMSKISVAVDTGGAKLQRFATIAGLTGAQFATLFKQNPAEALTRFVEGLAGAGLSGQNLTVILKDLGLKGANVQDVMKRLAGGGDQVRVALDLAKSSWAQNTALASEYQKRAETTQSQLIILKNRIQDVAIALGTAMLPTLKQVVGGMDPLVKHAETAAGGFARLPQPIQSTALALGGLLIAAGPIVWAFGKMESAWSAFLAIFRVTGITAALAGVGESVALVVAGFTGAAGGVGGFAGAMEALAVVMGGAVTLSFTTAAAALGAFWAGWKAGSFLDSFTIGGLSPSEWVAFLVNWKLGLGDVSAENLRLGITSARMGAEAAAALAQFESMKAGFGITPNTKGDIELPSGKKVDTVGTGGGGTGGIDEKSPYAKALKSIADGMENAKAHAQAWATQLGGLGGVASKTATQKEELHKALQQVIDKYGSLKAAGLGALEPLFTATQALLKTTSSFLTIGPLPTGAVSGGTQIQNIAAGLTPEGLLRSASAIEPLKENIEALQRSGLMSTAAMVELGNQIGELPNVVPQGTQAIQDARDSMQSFGGTVKSALLGLPGILQAAFEGGGGVVGAFKSFAVGLGTQFGEILTSSIKSAVAAGASVFNAVGAKAAGAVGAISGLGAAMSGASGKASAAAVAMTGVSVAAGAIGTGATIAGAAALGAATAGIGLAAVGAFFAIKKLLNDTEKKVNPVREQFVQLNGGLAALAEKARLAGTDLTAMLNAKTPEQYKAAVDALTASFDFQKSAMETLTATAQKYGFTLEELGPTLQRQQLGEQAATLFQDFQVLTAGGLNVDAILNRMSESVNAFVAGALRTGTEVPAAMMPMLQQFIDAGLLLDLNGNKITDLETSGITFATTLTEGFKSVVDAVKLLTDAIARGLGIEMPAAAAAGAAAVGSAINKIPKDIKFNVVYGDGGQIPGQTGGGGITYWPGDDNLPPPMTLPGMATGGGLVYWPGDDNLPPPMTLPGMATGGLVTSHGIQRFGMGGFVLPFRPRGTDTVPAMLTPGELVLNQAQQEAFGRPAGGAPPGSLETQPSERHVHVYLGDKEVADFVLDAIGDGGKTYGKAERIVRQMVSNRR